MNHFIPLSIPNFEGNEEKYVLDAVRQGWVSTGGAYITKFEKQLAEFVNVPVAAACQSGTAALHLALIECGVSGGDGVSSDAYLYCSGEPGALSVCPPHFYGLRRQPLHGPC